MGDRFYTDAELARFRRQLSTWNALARRAVKDQTATCPACGRTIIVESGRFTVHTNPGRAEPRKPPPRCLMAEQSVPSP